MSYRGHIENGSVIPETPITVPDGTEVEIVVLEPQGEAAKSEIPSFYEQHKNLIGIFDDLPSDFARNHDHYIHGAPKK